jgi:biopolymer transport protein ExbB/TolQ
MYPLALFSILGIAILIEKMTWLRRISETEIEEVRSLAAQALKGEAKPPAGSTPIRRILGRLYDLGRNGITSEALTRSSEREVARLEDVAMRGMIWLAIIGDTSPFIGLFGTVIGIIRAFHGLSTAGLLTDPAGNPELIRGIAEALVATATGLMVAVPAVIFYNFLLREIRSRMTRVELACADYADALGSNGGHAR